MHKNSTEKDKKHLLGVSPQQDAAANETLKQEYVHSGLATDASVHKQKSELRTCLKSRFVFYIGLLKRMYK